MAESIRDSDLFSTTESFRWNYLQTLGACVSGRLGRFSRAGAPRIRPKERGNNAALIEMDLDFILRTALGEHHLTKEIFEKMDEAALDLLHSLDIMVNLNLITREGTSTNWNERIGTVESDNSQVIELKARVDTFATLQTDFTRLQKLMSFLTSRRITTDQRQFSLMTGLCPLFILPLGDSGGSTMDSLRKWIDILQTLQGRPQPHDDYSFVSLEPMAEPHGPDALDRSRGESVSNIVQDIFNEFRQLGCVKKTTHEIRLHVTDDLYSTRPGHERNIEMFISCCPGSTLIWQNAECGEFLFDDPVEHCICDRIRWAMRCRRKLYIMVNSKGVFDVTDRLSVDPLRCDSFDGTSLSELLKQDIFRPIDLQAYLDETAEKRVDSATKAQVALGLSRCLMHFFDKGLELASHSWIADNVHFRESSDGSKGAKKRLLYVSLRPKLHQNPVSDIENMFNNGSPVVLSFVKLLLEVLDGNALNIQVRPHEEDNLLTWLELGSAVQRLRLARDGDLFASRYLEVVDGCLRLWTTFSNRDNLTDPSGTVHLMRKAIYETVVSKLELIASSGQTWRRGSDIGTNHEQGKRKFHDPMVNQPPVKKLALIPKTPPFSGSLGLVNGQNPCFAPSDKEDSIQTALDDSACSGQLSLYDEQGGTNEREQQAAEEHLSDLIRSMGMYVKAHANSGRNEKNRIKVAIIDSGVDPDDGWIRARSSQIVDKRNWTSCQIDDCADICGHGTHITRLILKVAPAAEVYIAKVSKRKKFEPEVAGQVAQYQLMKAIEWAVGVWKVDIISLSMAMDGENPTIKKALDEVLRPPYDSPKKVVVIAAASNWGGNRHIAFPASSKGVICIHSTDGHGNPSKTNPTAQKGKDFAVLGMSIKSSIKGKNKKRTEVYISGTSYATAIGVGIAANVLEVAKGDSALWDGGKGKLCSSWGMSCVFKIMSEERAGYRNVMPWRLFDGRPEEDVYRDIKNALEPDV
ncbi:hypothetical protein CEP53_011014 [Fusarium sp. AF-6]|nr:hypothetical protein CEP53_011014 [Fusarium sp. AF-6]